MARPVSAASTVIYRSSDTRMPLSYQFCPAAGGGVHAGKPRQYGIHHTACHGTPHAKLVVAHALEQFTGGNEVHLIPRPVLTGVDEVLGIIHDLHGGAAVHGELDTILGRNGVLDDLLGAIRMDKHGHRARLHIGARNLHLGLACTLGYFDVHHGRGIGIPGGLDLNRGLDRLTILLGVLDGLAAQLGLRRGLAVLVGLHRAGGAIGGLVLGDGAAVGLGGGLRLPGAAGIVTVRG